MRSGRASKDLYVRVFLPLMRELEETSRRYEAVTSNNTEWRQNKRPAGSGAMATMGLLRLTRPAEP
jgi:hypothetical protein